MTITLSEKIQDHAQRSGERKIRYRFTFHTGEIIETFQMVPSDYDASAGMTAMATKIEADMIEAEDGNLIAGVESGTVDSVTAIPVHPETETSANRQKRWLRKLIRWAMREDDIKLVKRMLYPIWYQFKFVEFYTPAQIQNILDITPEQYTKFNTRLTAYHNNLDLIDNDSDYVEEIE